MNVKPYFFGILCLTLGNASASEQCEQDTVSLQILGSGGPELNDGRTSTSYLIWHQGKARVLIDAGAGASTQFEKAGGDMNDLEAILLTHLHVDHSQDIPAFVKSSFFSGRETDLTIYGPSANRLMPGTADFVQRLFSSQGAYPYLSHYTQPNGGAYQLSGQDVPFDQKKIFEKKLAEDLSIKAISVHHGPVAAVAWRVDVGQCSISFSGDMSNRYQTLKKLVRGSDWLVAHNAIPEDAKGVGRLLHMPPSEIGKIARSVDVNKLILSHFMNRTSDETTRKQTLKQIQTSYAGEVFWAEDMAHLRF